MGQGVARAMTSGATAYQRKQQALNLENMALQNEQLKAQIAGSKLAVAKQAGMPKPFPSHMPTNEVTSDHVSGRAPIHDPLVGTIERALAAAPKVVRDEVIGSSPDNPLRTAGHHAPVSLLRTANGFQMVPSKSAKERIEDSMWDELSWRYNVVKDAYAYQPPKKYLKPGHRWHFEPITLTFKQVRKF